MEAIQREQHAAYMRDLPMYIFGFHIVTHVLLCCLVNFYFEYHGISDKTDAETTKLFPKSR